MNAASNFSWDLLRRLIDKRPVKPSAQGSAHVRNTHCSASELHYRCLSLNKSLNSPGYAIFSEGSRVPKHANVGHGSLPGLPNKLREVKCS